MQKASVDMQVAGLICIIYRSNQCSKKENELSTENESNFKGYCDK